MRFQGATRSRVGSRRGSDFLKLCRRLLDPPYHSVRRVFPSTAGRLALQAVPSRIISGLSPLPAYAVRCSVCIRPSCTSWSERLSRTVSGRRLDCAPPWRVITPPPQGSSLGFELCCLGPSCRDGALRSAAGPMPWRDSAQGRGRTPRNRPSVHLSGSGGLRGDVSAA